MKTEVRSFKWESALKYMLFFGCIVACFYVANVFAQGSQPTTPKTLGDIASNITTSFQNIGKLLFATAYLAGFGFVIAAVFKFKQHKDNPTQIPMGTPIAMLCIGIALIFLPSIIKPAGTTIFGSNPTSGGYTGSGGSQPTVNQ